MFYEDEIKNGECHFVNLKMSFTNLENTEFFYNKTSSQLAYSQVYIPSELDRSVFIQIKEIYHTKIATVTFQYAIRKRMKKIGVEHFRPNNINCVSLIPALTNFVRFF